MSGSDQAVVDAVNFVTTFAGAHDRLCMSMVISLRKLLVWSIFNLADTGSAATHSGVRRLTWLLTRSGYEV